MSDDRFIVQLRAKLLNAADELSGSAAIASDSFKAVVTGEPSAGRDVYRSAVSFRPLAQHVFATNTLPSFSGGMDRGVQRRLLVVLFNRVIPKEARIEHIGMRVGDEEPDLLLAWAVAGASRLIRQRGFTIPASSSTALQNWLFGADPVLAWARARLDPADEPKPGQKEIGIKSGDAHAEFIKWALLAGYRKDILPASNGFVQRLQAASSNLAGITIRHRHTMSGNWLFGLKILGFDRDPDVDGIKAWKPPVNLSDAPEQPSEAARPQARWA